MSDSKKKPFRELQDVAHEMDEMFDRFVKQEPTNWGRVWRPNTDVFESQNEMIVLVELAGVKKEEVQLTLEGNILRLVGERTLYREKADMTYRNMEVSFGAFERNIHLNASVEPGSIQAFYRDGFLEIKIQKRAQEKAESQTIEIETNE